MESKRMNEYFMKAKQLPLALSMADVKTLVSAKGVTSPPKKSWWNLNNIIIMTTTVVISSLIILLSTTEKQAVSYTPKNSNLKSETYIVLETPKEKEIYWTEAEEKKEKGQVEDSVKTVPLIMTELQPNRLFLRNNKLKRQLTIEPSAVEPLELNASIDLIEEETVGLNEEINGESKTITKSIDASNIQTFVLHHKNGEINVETWDSNTIEVTAVFILETEKPEDMRKGLDNFIVKLEQQGTKAIAGTNWDQLNNCNCNTGQSYPKKGILKLLYFPSKNKAKTDEGESFEYEKFKISYQVKIPKRLSVELSNKYGDIILADIEGSANINLFRGDLSAGNLGEELDLTVKYGSATLGDFKRGDVVFFRSEKNRLGNAEQLKLLANYSRIEAGSIQKLDLTAFRSDLTVNGAIDELVANLKYGELKLKENASRTSLTALHGKIEAQDLLKLTIHASYTTIKARMIDELEMENAFRSKIKVSEIGILKGDLKYSPVSIEVLRNSIDIIAFRSEIKVAEVQAGFDRMNLNLKYSDINFRFNPDSKYDLDAETNHTGLNLPAEIKNVNLQNGENTHSNHTTGTFNSKSSKVASKVYVNSFEGNLTLD